jgi:hypothetical protein
MEWSHVDVALLRSQEAYFEYTMECLQYLANEYAFRNKRNVRTHSSCQQDLSPLHGETTQRSILIRGKSGRVRNVDSNIPQRKSYEFQE